MNTDNQVTVSTLRQGFESLGAGEMADAAIAIYVVKRFKDVVETSNHEQAVKELSSFSRELKTDAKTADLAKIVDLIALGMAFTKN